MKESIAISFLYSWECCEYWKALCAIMKLPYVEELFRFQEKNLAFIEEDLESEVELRNVYATRMCKEVA